MLDRSCQPICKIIRNEQQIRRLLKILRMLLLQRQKLIDRIELLLLYARPLIKALLIRHGLKAVSAAVAIADSIPYHPTILVQENEIDSPGIDGKIISLPRFPQSFDDSLIKSLDIPHKRPIIPGDQPVRE